MSKFQTYTYRLQVRGHFAHQDACSEAHVGDSILVIPESENELDSNPILFHNRTGDLLGHAPAEVNEELLSLMTERCFRSYFANVVDLVYTGDGDIQPIVEVIITNQE